MPALKMKPKSSSGCLKEGTDLRACSKSIKISKSSHFKAKISQQAAVLHNSIQNDQDVSSNIEVSGQERTAEGVENQELLAGATLQCQKLPFSLFDSSVGRADCLPVTCPSISETIFSPIFEINEVHCEPINHYSAVGNDEKPDVARVLVDDSDDGSSGSCVYQTCDVSDFYSLSFDGDEGFHDIMKVDPFPDYECIDPDLMFDTEERYMILPFLEDAVETSDIHDGELVEQDGNSDDACLYLAIHQMKAPNQETDIKCFSGDLDEADYIDQYLFLRNLPELSEVVPSLLPVLLPKETRKRKHITLVLDLDETLVHSTLDHCDDADFSFPVFFNMKEHTVYVRQRPYLQIFLERVAEMFEIIIFTASQSIYAEQLLNILDPDRKFISKSIYRESCIFSDGSYIKDLTVLGLNLEKVAIIDNTPKVFRLQVNNGIPIQSWFDDPSDRELILLLPFLETLVDADDVRPIIASRFCNTE